MTDQPANISQSRSQNFLIAVSLIADVLAVAAFVAAPSAVFTVMALLATAGSVIVLLAGWGQPFRGKLLLGVLGLLIGAVTLAALYLPGILPQTSAAAECDGDRVAVTAPSEVYEAEYPITITVKCEPREGERYALVSQVLKIGRPNQLHSEWYVVKILDPARKDVIRHTGSVAKRTTGSQNDLYVISVPIASLADLNEGSGDPHISPPPGEMVSNRVRVTKGG